MEITIISDPLSSVKHDGILGFGLGDNKNAVCSKITKLGINAKEHGMTIIIKDERISGISYIQLDFNDKNMLCSILVFFHDNVNTTPQQLIVLLVLKLSQYIGKPSLFPEDVIQQEMYVWHYGDHKIVLSYGTDFDTSDKVTLSFDKENEKN